MPFCAAQDKDVERMARKFKLDDHVTSRLMELKAPVGGSNAMAPGEMDGFTRLWANQRTQWAMASRAMLCYVKYCQRVGFGVSVCPCFVIVIQTHPEAICQDMSRYVKICQDMSRYVMICQDMSRYVKMPLKKDQ